MEESKEPKEKETHKAQHDRANYRGGKKGGGKRYNEETPQDSNQPKKDGGKSYNNKEDNNKGQDQANTKYVRVVVKTKVNDDSTS